MGDIGIYLIQNKSKEKFFLQMVKNGLNILDITPEWLYLKLKNEEP